jgi:NAD(P)-dependent dehydrogenase (short-subunit alcohol dehydrogenase family)
MPFPDNFTALVTGGGSGLGRAFSLELAKRGGRVVDADINVKAAQETVDLLAGSEALAVRCDVSKVSEFEEAIKAATDRFGAVDVLVNNAGVAVAGPIGVIPLEDWSFIVGVNLMGVVHGCHLLAPKMKATGRGWILNVASAAGLVSTRDMGPYNMTKAGVVALSETLMQEVVSSGVNVTVLCPTFFKTSIAESGRNHGEKDMMKLATKLMEKSALQAPEVACYAIDALERGELYAVPMADGRWMWRMKRIAPQFFYSTLTPKARNWIIARMSRNS